MELLYPESYYCCENCQYYINNQCHCNPPVNIITEDFNHNITTIFTWPAVKFNDYCGEFCIKHTYKKSRS